MSELKAFDVGLGQYCKDGSPCVVAFDADQNPRLLNEKVYLKSEADKVFAELSEKHKTEVKELLCLIRDKENNFNRAFDSEEKEIRHQKYKRCLDNAWGCQQRMELFHELVLEEARTIALPNEAALKEYRSKRERAAKWYKRWLKIAEKFKDGK